MDLSNVPILSIITFVPLVGAIVVALLPSAYARPTALVVALLAWVASLALVVAYAPGEPGFQYTETVDWIPCSGSSTSSAPTGCRPRSSC